MRNRVNRAFTLVEILIVVVILGILAAIVIPQFTSASEEAQVGNVQTQLQTIRSQVELFRVRNNGNPPAIVGEGNDAFMDLRVGTNASDAALRVDNSFGQEQKIYMSTIPLNPRNKRGDVAEDETPRASAAAAAAASDGPGWFFNSTTGEFAAAGFDEETNTWVLPE